MTIKPALVWIALELVGITLVVIGVAHWSVAAALIVGGVALILEAYALERR